MALTAMADNWLLPLSGRQQYTVSIMGRGAEVSGICIIVSDDDGHRGAIVNEFGIHAFNFTLTADRRRVRLRDVMPALDRWYIRRIVRKDLRCLFSAVAAGSQKGRRRVTVDADGTVTLTNEKYNLKYSLKKIDETAQ